MFYQVRANLYFTNPDEARDFYHDCELALAKTSIINPAMNTMEFSQAELIENHHDQDPLQPCVLLASIANFPP